MNHYVEAVAPPEQVLVPDPFVDSLKEECRRIAETITDLQGATIGVGTFYISMGRYSVGANAYTTRRSVLVAGYSSERAALEALRDSLMSERGRAA